MKHFIPKAFMFLQRIFYSLTHFSDVEINFPSLGRKCALSIFDLSYIFNFNKTKIYEQYFQQFVRKDYRFRYRSEEFKSLCMKSLKLCMCSVVIGRRFLTRKCYKSIMSTNENVP